MVRICADCGADISHKGNRAKRCDNCLGPYYLKRMEKKKTSQMLSRGGYEYTLPSQDIRQISNHEGYPYQSTGKEYFKIFQGTNITRIKKICRSCGKDDSFVRGKWAPIYSETDFRGVELDYILLCLDCYQSKCEGS